MNFLVDFFIRNFKLTIVLTCFMVIFGLQGLNKMNAEAWPQVDFATAFITTNYKGASPEDIEALITKPIEDEIRTVSGLKDVKSTSQTGLSMIMVRIDMDNVDEEEVMDDLQKAVQRVSKLPSDLEQQPLFLELKSDEFPAIEIAVIGSGEKRERDAIADILKDEIEDIDAAKEVRPTGFREREFTIGLDRLKMDQLHIGVVEVLGKLASRNITVPGGDIEKGAHKDLVKLEAKVKNVQDLKDLVVRSNINGNAVFLKDIAHIEDGAEEPRTLASYNGEEAVLLTVNKKTGADTLKLAAAVRELIKKYEKTWKGKAKFKAYYDEGVMVDNKLSTLFNNALSGLLLLFIFLLIFMPGWVGVMAGLSLPIGIMATFGMMPAFGLNLDSMSILAFIIAMGNLVDNSIVITDNFINLRRQGLEIIPAVKRSVMELWAPITATVLTTIASFLPMLVTKGIMGEFIRPIPIVVTLALVVSLVESFFLLPMRLVFVGKRVKKETDGKTHWFDRWKLKFEVFMRWVVIHRYITVGGCLGLILASLLLMIFGNKFILFPAEQTELYTVRIEAPRGTSIETTSAYAAELSQEIMKRTSKWSREVTGRAGTSKFAPDDPKGGDGDSQGLVMIYANDFAKFNIPHTQYLAELRKIDTKKYGTVTFEEMINGPPVGSPINATFRSDTAESLQHTLDHMLARIKALPGVMDVKVDDVVDADEILVKLDYKEADSRGVSVSDIGTTIRTALGGIYISDVTLNNKEVNLNVKFLDNFKTSPEELGQIKIMDRQGNLIPLGSIASFEPRSGTPQVKRFDFKRARTIVGQIDEKLTSAFEVNQVIKKEWAMLGPKYPEVSLEFGGVEESTQESMQSLLDALILAIVGIFALLVFMFHSFLRPFIIMMTIPLGFIGFSVAFFLHGKPISFLALIGIIGLTGIIVNSGIVLIEFIEIARKEGMPLEEALVKASSQRLLAVVATAFSTMLGLFPTAYGIGGQDQMLIPITLAMAWGLTSGTFLTLIFIPPAYALVEDWVAFISRNKFIKKIYSIPFLQDR
ncbi:MAG TPA: efflux RND transporter permease subunit [Bacteriovoracaceae bacterium]|nr:efflux RND transporter permease subunit [Bacteriovoracaceae bacterium]